MRVHVLSPGFTNPNSMAFLFPLFRFRRALTNAGFDVRVFYHETPDLKSCDALLIESKAFKHRWQESELPKTLEFLQSLQSRTKLIWCDQVDSSGTFQGHVLPYVHVYAKSQILKNLDTYRYTPYGGRIYSDFYHRHNGIIDSEPYRHYPAAAPEDLKKIRVSWNSGLMHYGFLRPYLMKLWPFLPMQHYMGFAGAMAPPQSPRPIDISCRMGVSYPRASVAFQRRALQQSLATYLRTDKLSHGAYLRELCLSKICVSPFGYGEITLKDFEAFLCGAALFKPDMAHMQTWPDFFEKDVTYIAHDWTLETVTDQLQKLLQNTEQALNIAEVGQGRYLHYTRGPEAASLFVRQFASVLA